MIFSTEVKSYLYKKIGAEDTAASSHWKFWHRHLQVDEEMNLIKSRGFGDGRSPHNRFEGALHKLIQRRFVKKIKQNEMFYFLEKIAREKCNQNQIRFSLDTLRQVLTLSYLVDISPNGLNADTSIVIGDGFGTLTHLLLESSISRKVILVSLTATLFADTACILKCKNFQHPRAICLVADEFDMVKAIEDPEIKIVLVEAKHCKILDKSCADIAFSIASMQEMNYREINAYFDNMRNMAPEKEFLFYCCNRESKILPDGQIIEFEKYPWSKEDIIIFDEPCPWHDKYYRSVLPIYYKYDGVHRHRLAKMGSKK